MLAPHSPGALWIGRCLIMGKTAEADEKADEASDIITLIDENKDATYHGLCHSLSVFPRCRTLIGGRIMKFLRLDTLRYNALLLEANLTLHKRFSKYRRGQACQ